MRYDLTTFTFQETDLRADQFAIQTPTSSLSWSELHQQTDKIAAALEKAGVTKGQPIFIYGNESALQFAALLACVKKECPFVPVHSATPVRRLELMQKICGSKVMISIGRPPPAAFDLQITLDEQGVLNTQVHFSAAASELNQESPLYLIFTSGSTGDPKAVVIMKSNVTAYINLAMSTGPNTQFSDIVVNEFSFGFDALFIPFFAALHRGCTFYHLASTRPRSVDMHQLNGLSQATAWYMTPASLSKKLIDENFNSVNYPHLQSFMMAGEQLRMELVQRLAKAFAKADFWNLYGPTETTVASSFEKIDKAWQALYASAPIGKLRGPAPLHLVEADTDHDPVLFEIHIKGEVVSPGYLNTNSNSFFKDNEGRKTYNTGDLGSVQDGLIFFHERRDRQIKLHGHRIDLSEIESAVSKSNLIQESVCVALKKENIVKKIVCFVLISQKTAEEQSQIIAQLKKWLADSMPSYMNPHEILAISEWPLNLNLKIDKGALVKKFFND